MECGSGKISPEPKTVTHLSCFYEHGYRPPKRAAILASSVMHGWRHWRKNTCIRLEQRKYRILISPSAAPAGFSLAGAFIMCAKNTDLQNQNCGTVVHLQRNCEVKQIVVNNVPVQGQKVLEPGRCSASKNANLAFKSYSERLSERNGRKVLHASFELTDAVKEKPSRSKIASIISFSSNNQPRSFHVLLSQRLRRFDSHTFCKLKRPSPESGRNLHTK